MEETKINENCPKCDNWKVFYHGRLGGIGYSDVFTCSECHTKFQVMYMNDKPVHKRVIKEGK